MAKLNTYLTICFSLKIVTLYIYDISVSKVLFLLNLIKYNYNIFLNYRF